MARLIVQADAAAVGRIQFEKNGGGPSAFRRIENLVEGAGISITDVDVPGSDRFDRTIAASVSAGDTVNLLGLVISDSSFTTPGGALPPSTINVPSNVNRKLLIVHAQSDIQVGPLTGGDVEAKTEVKIGASTIDSLGVGRSPVVAFNASSGAPRPRSTVSAMAVQSGAAAQNPGNVTWGNFVRTGAADSIDSTRRVLMAIEVVTS